MAPQQEGTTDSGVARAGDLADDMRTNGDGNVVIKVTAYE